jgi:hypothetical protein
MVDKEGKQDLQYNKVKSIQNSANRKDKKIYYNLSIDTGVNNKDAEGFSENSQLAWLLRKGKFIFIFTR